MLAAEAVWQAGATRYTNRYRNGWTAAVAVARQALDDARRPGRKQRSASAIPYADMPQPVPVSRFQWPQPQVWHSVLLGATSTPGLCMTQTWTSVAAMVWARCTLHTFLRRCDVQVSTLFLLTSQSGMHTWRSLSSWQSCKTPYAWVLGRVLAAGPQSKGASCGAAPARCASAAPRSTGPASTRCRGSAEPPPTRRRLGLGEDVLRSTTVVANL